MGNLFGGMSQSKAPTRYNAIQLSSSAYGNCVPLVYGTTRGSLTLAWYGDFKAIAQSAGGSKGGGGGQTTGYDYHASWIGLLCKGAIYGVGVIYKDQEQTTLGKQGLFFTNGWTNQAVWSYLVQNHPEAGVTYQGTAYVAIANQDLGGSAGLPNYSFELYGIGTLKFAYLGTQANTILDAHPSDVVKDYCTDPIHGAGFNFLDPNNSVNSPTSWFTYVSAMGLFVSYKEDTQRPANSFISELLKITNSDAVWTAGVGLRFVPYGDTPVSGSIGTVGYSYTPNLTPIYTFIDADYVVTGKDQPPVIKSVKPANETYNVWNVEYIDRNNQYNTAIAQYRDEVDIGINGMRVAPSESMHGIADVKVANTVAAILCQRNIYIRATFEFTVRGDYALLEPMDLIGINDSNIGIVNQLARISEITENTDGSLTIVAEEMMQGPAHAPLYNTQLWAGFAANYGADPGPVNTPYIFTAPPLLVNPTTGGTEIWIATNGSGGEWGGCFVFVSFDNVSYSQVGYITRPARYGTLTGAVNAGASTSTPDTSNSISVQLYGAVSASNVLNSISQAAADKLTRLAVVDGEVISYRTATPQGTETFGLSYIWRGLYGSGNTSHLSGTKFTLLDDAIFRLPMDPGYAGNTIYFKFQSFNQYAGGLEDISTLPAYSIVLQANANGQLLPQGAVPLSVVAGNDAVIYGPRIGKKTNASSGWTADVFSRDAFATGCIVQFRPMQTNKIFIIGLSSSLDLSTEQNGFNQDYAWYFNSDGTAYIFEKGLTVFSGPPVTTYDTNSIFKIVWDGKFVSYICNGVTYRTAPRNLTVGPMVFNANFFTPGGYADNVSYASQVPITGDGLRAMGNGYVNGESVGKVNGVSTWVYDGAYSLEGYTTAHVSAKLNATSDVGIIGLTATPGPNIPGHADAVLTIAFGWYAFNGVWELLINGVLSSTGLQINASDRASILYNGTLVSFYLDETLVSIVAAGALSNLPLFGEFVVFNSTGGFNSARFGPTTQLDEVGTGSISTNAVSVIFTGESNSTTTNSLGGAAAVPGTLYDAGPAGNLASATLPLDGLSSLFSTPPNVGSVEIIGAFIPKDVNNVGGLKAVLSYYEWEDYSGGGGPRGGSLGYTISAPFIQRSTVQVPFNNSGTQSITMRGLFTHKVSCNAWFVAINVLNSTYSGTSLSASSSQDTIQVKFVLR